MIENLDLEAFQEEAYNDVLGTYIFEVEGAGVTSETSRELESKKKGIVLHFLRYGIFNSYPWYIQENKFVRAPDLTIEEPEQPEEGLHYKLDEVVVTAQRKRPKPSNNSPELTKGDYERTGLRSGYLYILHEDESNYWIEYEIDALGFLYPIFWKENKKGGEYLDIRDVVSTKKKESYTVKPNTFF